MATLNELQKNFKDLVKSGQLAHAYVFYGPDLAEQFEFAKELAHFIENGSWEAGERPLSDARFIDGATDDVGIDTARSVSDFLYQQPNVSPRRVLVINEASKLNHLAQNALLKVAEEPPSRGLLILIVRDLGSLLPTLVSRFAKVYFAQGAEKNPVKSQGDHGASEEGSKKKEAATLVREFIGASNRGQSDLIKKLIKEEGPVNEFVESLIGELNRHPQVNWRALKELHHRYELMNQYNVNKRLQLEAVLPYLSNGKNS